MTAPIQALLMTGSPRDPYFADVVTLLHFDGTVGATSYTNNGSVGSWANSSGSDPALSATQVKFGSASLHYTSTSNKATCPTTLALGTSDFTIEYWIYLGSLLGVFVMFDMRTGGTEVSPTIYGDSSGKVYFYVNGVNVISSAASALATGAWTFIALSKASGTSRLFVNGTQVGSSYADSNSYLTRPQIVGTNFNGIQPCNGSYIDEVRVTNGVGRYTSNFSNPTTPFPNH